jgi:hypothetical protein
VLALQTFHRAALASPLACRQSLEADILRRNADVRRHNQRERKE